MATISLATVGDVMCGESFYAYRRGPRTGIAALGRDYLPPDLRALLARHDLALANVECVLSDADHRPGRLRSEHMRGDPAAAESLAAWGLTVANLANNHILEHGRDAARDTARRLRDAGLTVIGDGIDGDFGPACRRVELECRGARVGLLGACLLDEKYAYDGGADLEACLEHCRQLAARCELTIVSLHWGVEFMDRPAPAQVALANRFIEAGANVLLGHHPHVVQGVERRGDALIAYSLGNFIFDQPLPDARWSTLLSATFEDGRCREYTLHALELDRRHAPQLAAGPRADALQRELARRNGLLGDAASADPDAYAREARHRQCVFRRAMWAHLARSAWRFPPGYQAQLVLRPLARRLGRW